MVDEVRKSLMLWAYQLVPSLFPFMVLSNLFLQLSNQYFSIKNKYVNNFCKRIFGLSIHSSYILFLGHICGYPLGAKMTADAYHQKQITYSEANYLLTICNQSSPAFLEYYIATYALNNMLSSQQLLSLFYVITLFTSFITRRIYHPENQNKQLISSHIDKTTSFKRSFFSTFDKSISDSCITILRIGGYVVIFSILSSLIISNTHIPNLLKYPLAASLEISNGTFLLKEHLYETRYYIYLILVLSGFGGFCTMAQIKGMLVGTSLSIKPYIIGKIIYTLLLLSASYLLFEINIFQVSIK